MKILAYIPLHYGSEYLECCIKSMCDFVDKIIIVYTPNPSQGFRTENICPETEKQLRDIAICSSHKVRWHNRNFCTEGEHRNYIYNYSRGYDLVFTLDADEVAEPNDIDAAFKLALNDKNRFIGSLDFLHFWRSFNHVLTDGFLPVRITNLRRLGGITSIVPLRIYHFSCVQSENIIRYKWGISGHSPELRENWIDGILYGWTAENNLKFLHPVSEQIWYEAQKFDKNLLPDILKTHPNFNKEIL